MSVQTYSPIQFVNTQELPDRPKEAKNDCFVRAIASGLELPYSQADTIATEKFMRAKDTGTSTDVIQLIIKQLETAKESLAGFQVRSLTESEITNNYNNGGVQVVRKMTFGSFLNQKKEGTFLVGIRGHAMMVRDGIIHGNADDCMKVKSRVIWAVQLTKVKQEMVPVKSEQKKEVQQKK